MPTQSTALLVNRRQPSGSRGARRARRTGVVLGTVYGGGEDPVSFQVEARALRTALTHAGAVIDLTLDGDAAGPVVLKDRQRHPVSGATMHIDLMRVDLSKPIQAQVALELTGVEESDVRAEGGVLEHSIHELTVEALPAAVPEVISHSIAGLKIGHTVTLGDIVAPPGAKIIGDPEQVIVTIHASRGLAEGGAESGGPEQETAVVGEAGAAEKSGDSGH